MHFLLQVTNEDSTVAPLKTEEINTNKKVIKDIVLNVRVQRPFHKKTHCKKACK